MVISMKGSGRIGYIMVRGPILGLKETVIGGNGRMVNFMVMEY